MKQFLAMKSAAGAQMEKKSHAMLETVLVTEPAPTGCLVAVFGKVSAFQESRLPVLRTTVLRVLEPVMNVEQAILAILVSKTAICPEPHIF